MKGGRRRLARHGDIKIVDGPGRSHDRLEGRTAANPLFRGRVRPETQVPA